MHIASLSSQEIEESLERVRERLLAKLFAVQFANAADQTHPLTIYPPDGVTRDTYRAALIKRAGGEDDLERIREADTLFRFNLLNQPHESPEPAQI